jgi:anti-sigma factor RsiW
MTTTERPIGEDELHAYVDGFLARERRLTVERYLDDHPEAAARIAGWQAVGEALRNAAAWKFQEPVPASLNIDQLAEARIAHRWGPWRMAAMILVTLAVGAGAGWVVRGPGNSGGAAPAGSQKVASDSPSGRQAVQLAAGQPGELQGQLTEGSGGAVTPPDLSKSGYRLLGRQVVPTDQGPRCMLTYSDAQGTHITLLMPPTQKHETSATEFAEAGSGNGGRAPQAAEAGGDTGAHAPQFAEAGGGNSGRAPQLAEAGADSGGRVPRLAEAGGGNTGRVPQLAEVAGGNGGGATTAAKAAPCS